MDLIKRQFLYQFKWWQNESSHIHLCKGFFWLRKNSQRVGLLFRAHLRHRWSIICVGIQYFATWLNQTRLRFYIDLSWVWLLRSCLEYDSWPFCSKSVSGDSLQLNCHVRWTRNSLHKLSDKCRLSMLRANLREKSFYLRSLNFDFSTWLGGYSLANARWNGNRNNLEQLPYRFQHDSRVQKCFKLLCNHDQSNELHCIWVLLLQSDTNFDNRFKWVNLIFSFLLEHWEPVQRCNLGKHKFHDWAFWFEFVLKCWADFHNYQNIGHFRHLWQWNVWVWLSHNRRNRIELRKLDEQWINSHVYNQNYWRFNW